jgi:translocation protein SEC62
MRYVENLSLYYLSAMVDISRTVQVLTVVQTPEDIKEKKRLKKEKKAAKQAAKAAANGQPGKKSKKGGASPLPGAATLAQPVNAAPQPTGSEAASSDALTRRTQSQTATVEEVEDE